MTYTNPPYVDRPLLRRLAPLWCVILLAGLMRSGWGESSEDVEKKYYWQGSQLNNLGRLSAGPGDFETEEKHRLPSRQRDEYLAAVRAQMSNQAKSDEQARHSLNYRGNSPESALEIIHGDYGIQAILHLELLFDENTATLKNGAMDTLERLAGLIERQEKTDIHLLLADRVGDEPKAQVVDAERSLLVATLLNFSLERSAALR